MGQDVEGEHRGISRKEILRTIERRCSSTERLKHTLLCTMYISLHDLYMHTSRPNE